ncbi:LsmAD [Rhizoctonia solani]|uniref:LsmAD n=1 Tax=Rhizoctonia solani TaxID=456999 RepID=A0A8H7I8I1_9AGAM|nr:LsmAD [Rhizoctonia solani]
MTEHTQTTPGPKGINDVAGNVADALAPNANLTTQSTESGITDVVAGDGQESEDEGLGEDAGDPATEDLLAAMPDETEDIDLVHARLHTLAALRLPRFKDHLTRLCLRQNFLTHIGEEDIGSLVKLEELDFYDNKLKGVGDALDGLLDLKTLDLSFNLLRSVPHGLERHRYLHTIYFVQNKISKISGVSGLSGSLRSLELGGNRIRTIEGLEGLGQLEELWLGKNKITRLQSLRVLSIQSNRITKLEGLEELTNLEEFYISHNGLNKIEGLGKNLKLRTFDVSGNGITTVENLSHLSELEEFWASDNQIATLNDLERELGGIKSLSTIYLERNPCEKEDPTGYRRKVMLALPQTIDVGSVMYDSVMEAVQDQSTRAVVALKTTTTRADDERKSSHEQAEKRPRRERSWTRTRGMRGTGFNNPPGRQFGPSAGFPPLGATHGPAHHFMLATLVEHVFVLAAQIAGCVPQQQQQQQQQQSQQPSQPQSFGGNVDDLTFGPGSTSSTPWDQFSANEKMFGVVTSFNEEAYTTAIDRNAPDFKEKERKAEIIAKEIMAAASNNPHIAEERGAVDDSGLNEEDKYSSVIRGQNAYIPPGARRAAAAAANGTSTPVKSPDAKSPPPTVSTPVNTNNTGPAPTSTTTTATSPPAEASKPEVPKVAVNGSETPAKPGENNLVGSFREFVTNEKQRLAQKKQAIVKSEKEKRMAELVAFSQSFKLNKPIPKDLVSILTKDSEKAKQIVEKSSADAASAKARQIGGAQVASGQLLKKPAVSANPNPSPNPSATGQGKGTPAAAGAQSTTGVKKDGKEGLGLKPVVSNKEREPSPTSAAAAAREVKCECTHGHGSSPSAGGGATPSPKPKAPADASATPPNPFYGTKVFKKSQMMLKEEFNPFKFAKVAEASSVAVIAPNWPYTGRKFLMLFPGPTVPPQTSQPPPPQPQQPPTQTPQAAAPQPPHPPPPMQQQPTPPVPGPYEEEHARTPYMMYPYHYPYGGQPPMQPMIQVGTPAGPPGYMQPPYMPPCLTRLTKWRLINVPMYGGPMPGMSHMYMPPGPYPPGAQPRPPPHGYYHQSPQLGHAVPYPMMMQGPPGAPTPHQYDPNGPQNGPPGGPLGVGH